MALIKGEKKKKKERKEKQEREGEIKDIFRQWAEKCNFWQKPTHSYS